VSVHLNNARQSVRGSGMWIERKDMLSGGSRKEGRRREKGEGGDSVDDDRDVLVELVFGRRYRLLQHLFNISSK